MFAIEEGSDAFEALKRWFADPKTYKVTIAVRDGHQQISMKRNEGTWTLPYSVRKVN